jgi:hypothetical protein
MFSLLRPRGARRPTGADHSARSRCRFPSQKRRVADDKIRLGPFGFFRVVGAVPVENRVHKPNGFMASSTGFRGATTPAPGRADPALAGIVNAWPTLPEAIRAGIVAMVEAVGAARQ